MFTVSCFFKHLLYLLLKSFRHQALVGIQMGIQHIGVDVTDAVLFFAQEHTAVEVQHYVLCDWVDVLTAYPHIAEDILLTLVEGAVKAVTLHVPVDCVAAYHEQPETAFCRA